MSSSNPLSTSIKNTLGLPVFPLWLKLAVTLFLCFLTPVYWATYGFANFLWFSNIGLFGAALALWLEHRLLASMMLLAVFLADGVAWSMDFLCGLLIGWHPFDATTYMFDQNIPAYVRGLSFYHVGVPLLLAWMVYKLRYDLRALTAQTTFSCLVLVVCYGFTDPASNINWVFGVGTQPQKLISGWLYLILVMVCLPTVLYVPAHLLLQKMGWHREKG